VIEEDNKSFNFLLFGYHVKMDERRKFEIENISKKQSIY